MASLTPEGTEPQVQAYLQLIADNRARNQLRLEQAGLSELAQNALSHKPHRKSSKPRQKVVVPNPRRSTRRATLGPVSYQELSLAECERILKKMPLPLSPDLACSKTPGTPWAFSQEGSYERSVAVTHFGKCRCRFERAGVSVDILLQLLSSC